MFTKVEKTERIISQPDTNHVTKKQNIGKSGNRLEANPPGAAALSTYQAMADNNPQYEQIAQMQAMANDFSTAQPMPLLKKENLTGLPDQLKTGIENLSGFSMDDVRVHYNSNKPAQLQAHAYAQGTEIHVAPGQERHLPHEAWHVVQQKQGRVQPTRHLKGKIPVNDDAGLEREADKMGEHAMFGNPKPLEQEGVVNSLSDKSIQMASVIQRVPSNAVKQIKSGYGEYTKLIVGSDLAKTVTYDGVEYTSDERWIYQKEYRAKLKDQLSDIGTMGFQAGMTVGGAFAPGIDGLGAGRMESNVSHKVEGGLSKELAPGRFTFAGAVARLMVGKDSPEVTAMKKSLIAPKDYIGIRLLSNGERSKWLLYASPEHKERMKNLIVGGYEQNALQILDEQPFRHYDGT